MRDWTGRRFGRLVAIKPQEQRDCCGNTIWLFRCDCGGVMLTANIRGVRSCGCLTSSGSGQYAKCPDCGISFPIRLDGGKTPQFCQNCTTDRAGRNWRVCPICHELFNAPPSSKKITCSTACSKQWKKITHTGVYNNWGEAARQKKRAEGQTDNLKLGVEAARKSPVAGRFETNQEAKIWHLITPLGEEIVVRNLALWARQNAELFGKESCDRSAQQIAAGFRAIALTMAGKRKHPSWTYYGWTLKTFPAYPPKK